MTAQPTIRQGIPSDWPEVAALYPLAFPDEDLVPLVRALFGRGDCWHWVAVTDTSLVGHVAFTHCGVEGLPVPVAMLAPLAVIPSLHGQGIGSTLVKAGFAEIADAGIAHVLVLGSPTYYSRFGFVTEHNIRPPFPIPDEWAEAWQSVRLLPEAESLRGKLSLPTPWLDPALWAP